MLRGVRASARVLLHGGEVGRVVFRSGGSEFHYTDDLRGVEHHVLGQIFEEDPRHRYREPVGVPAWFANLLPEEGSGLRRYYAARFEARVIDDARLLLGLGDDLPGAVVVEPLDVADDEVLPERAEARLDGAGAHLSALAGAQLKMSVLRDGDRLTLPAAGTTGGWIAKFPDTLHRGLAENEYLMMSWAGASGITVPAVDLVDAADVPDVFERHMPPGAAVYLVERFDRGPGGSRTHIEDMAQVTGVPPMLRDRGASYDGIGLSLTVVAGSDDFVEYLRRAVAMVLMGNEDAHLKNWSLRYPDGRSASLAPAYDLVCTSIYPHLRRGLVFPLGGTRQTDAIGLEEFRALAGTAGHPADDAADIVRNTVRSMISAWDGVRDRALFADLVDHIDERLRSHPLARQTR